VGHIALTRLFRVMRMTDVNDFCKARQEKLFNKKIRMILVKSKSLLSGGAA
jgi:hypothetical protein